MHPNHVIARRFFASTYHVNCDFADFGGSVSLAEALDALLLLWNLISQDALQVGAV